LGISTKVASTIYEETSKIITKKILDKIKQLSTIEVDILLWWFGEDDYIYPITSKHITELKHFNKDWGNKAVMPKALGPFFHKDMGIPLETATSITEEVAKIMTRVAFKIWTERNKALEQWTMLEIKQTSLYKRKPTLGHCRAECHVKINIQEQ
jgi:hypothetical protein